MDKISFSHPQVHYNWMPFVIQNWVWCRHTWKSTTGYYVFIGSSLISWKTKKQAIFSRSSAKVEYRSMAFVCYVTWLQNTLHDLRINHSQPIKLFCDNQITLHVSSNPIFYERTKHKEIYCHLIRENIQTGVVKTYHISTSNQPAGVFTKSLSVPQFSNLVSKLRILNIYSNLKGECWESRFYLI